MGKPVVLHITPHLNGGLGRVLLSTLKFSKKASAAFAHEIVITDEKHLTPASLHLFAENSDSLHVGKSDVFIKEKTNQAGIVQIEWWNHPLIYHFLVGAPLPPSRVVLCSHVAGLTRPNIITESVVEFSDVFLAPSKATSYSCDCIRRSDPASASRRSSGTFAACGAEARERRRRPWDSSSRKPRMSSSTS